MVDSAIIYDGPANARPRFGEGVASLSVQHSPRAVRACGLTHVVAPHAPRREHQRASTQSLWSSTLLLPASQTSLSTSSAANSVISPGTKHAIVSHRCAHNRHRQAESPSSPLSTRLPVLLIGRWQELDANRACETMKLIYKADEMVSNYGETTTSKAWRNESSRLMARSRDSRFTRRTIPSLSVRLRMCSHLTSQILRQNGFSGRTKERRVFPSSTRGRADLSDSFVFSVLGAAGLAQCPPACPPASVPAI